jgi:hypothetical protein
MARTVAQSRTGDDDEFDIVPTSLAVAAMRDNGYKNAAYALAELIDNAVQAGATTTELFIQEEDQLVSSRTRRRAKEIAVSDNGCGMDAALLRKALQFGNGSRLDDRNGIGRFGMGLPNSSISQARRVDVWTWQDGYETAIHSYLDLREIQEDGNRFVPVPKRKPVPKEYVARSATIKSSPSGTLVVWQELDKCEWKTASAIFRNSEFTIGRIYRRFITKGKLRIRMCSFLDGSRNAAVESDEDVKPNDPMYLTIGTSCPAPWDVAPMFESLGAPHEFTYTDGKGRKHKVVVRFAIAKKAARDGHNPGDKPHGKHANNNLGVSIMRADRELELQTAWCINSEPRDRWWKIEVEFPPSLDEIFGVTNNKQHARALDDYARRDNEDIAAREGYGSYHEMQEAWEADKDPRKLLLAVKTAIDANLQAIRNSLRAQTERTRSRTRNPNDAGSAEVRGTAAIRHRQREGHAGTSDDSETRTPAERITDIGAALTEAGLDESEAAEKARKLVSDGRKFEFTDADIQTAEIFSVRSKGGALLITLNTSHPAYAHLISLLKEDEDTEDVEVLRARQRRSFEGLKLLIESWARYEDEVTDQRKKTQVQDIRTDWGRVARDFFEE